MCMHPTTKLQNALGKIDRTAKRTRQICSYIKRIQHSSLSFQHNKKTKNQQVFRNWNNIINFIKLTL